MSITRITDTATGVQLALGYEIDADEVIAAATADLTDDERAVTIEQCIRVEDDIDPDDLTDDEWTRVVIDAWSRGWVYRERGVTVWMVRPPTPTPGQVPDWPRDHGGVLVQAEGDERETAWRSVRSWAELRREVEDARDRIYERAYRKGEAERAALTPILDAGVKVAGLEKALTEARAVRDDAIRAALTAGVSAYRIAKETGLSAAQVGNIRKGGG